MCQVLAKDQKKKK
uniref:Uncharacterized protein n=1 Tax=Anguilla anguilla TaxID=7936 RepID=A0A0E9RUP6_ANGAN